MGDDEIEITDAMIAAATDVLFLYEPGDDGEWLAAAMYTAMESIRRASLPKEPDQ